MAETKILTFKFKAETTGSRRYAEIDANGNELFLQDAFIGTLYIRKKAMPNKVEIIKVTVEY